MSKYEKLIKPILMNIRTQTQEDVEQPAKWYTESMRSTIFARYQYLNNGDYKVSFDEKYEVVKEK